MVSQVALLFLTVCGLLIIGLTATTAKTKAISGPYTVIAVGYKVCDQPRRPYIKDPALKMNAEIKKFKKKGVLKGNVTILKDTRDMKTSFKEYFYEEGKWQISLNVKDLSCRSKLIADMLDMIDIIYDKKTCAVPKGTYSFEVDYNAIDHMWMPTREYGKMLRRVEVYNKAGTLMCWEFETLVEPEEH